jgi:uncharacterized repeat protein (TIGR01451 family)
MSRFRVGFAVVAIAVGVFVFTGGVANAAPIPGGDITQVCKNEGTTSGSIFTLTADCGPVGSSLKVPPNITTVDGGGHTISAGPTDTAGGVYTGAVLTNATSGQTMKIENLTITGPTAGFTFTIPANTCSSYFPGLFGIFFNDASGSVTNVTVLNMFQTRTPESPACIVGHSIRADGVTEPRTVNITKTHVSNYQRGGMFASGSVTVNVSDSTIGPGKTGPSGPFSIAQNAVQWSNCCTQSNGSVAPSGKITNSTIIGTNFLSTGPVDPTTAVSTAVLLFGARSVTVAHNTITGGSDIGIQVTAASTNSTIAFNAINRPTPPTPDSFGHGVDVSPDSAATTRLICNTFSGWKENIVGARQGPCITTPPLPPGSECDAYSVQLTASGTAPFTWTVGAGTLPPGLSLSSAGEITGTPTAEGTFHFTLKVVDATGLTGRRAETITIASDCGPPIIDKKADSPTVTAGGLAGFRITVTNRGNVTARNWWVCDEMPRGLTFVGATRKLRRLGQLRCLVIPTLRPHQKVGFHVTARVASNAPSTLTNDAEVIPGPPAGGPPPPQEPPMSEVGAKEKVRHPAASPAPPPPPAVTG